MTYFRVQFNDVLGELPALESDADLPEADVAILVNGFEPRCTAVARSLRDRGATVPMVITLHFPTNVDENAATWEDLDGAIEAFATSRGKVEMVGSTRDYAHALNNLIPRGSDDEPTKVLLDVSAASGRMILMTVQALFSAVRDDGAHYDLVVAYTEAETYAPSEEEASSKIAQLKEAVGQRSAVERELTLGLDRDAQETCVAYPGFHVEDGPDRAVVICGFNAHRVRAALDEIDTSYNVNLPHPLVTYIAGVPPRSELLWRLEAMKQLNAFGADPTLMHFKTTSTLDYQQTLHMLEQLYEDSFGVERITVLPFGSKMQTVATALFCEMHSDVRAQVVTPVTYQGANYSSGFGTMHLLRFGRLSDVIAALDRVGSIERR